MSLLFEVRCPVTHEVSLWPKRLARKVELTKELAEEFGISMEDIWTMAKVVREMGRHWLYDALEFQELSIRTQCDHDRLMTNDNLSFEDLGEIYWNAYRMLTLLWEHERDQKKRKKIEGYLVDIEEARQRVIELALPILHPQALAMLKEKAN
jgi:hypothetical protein